MTSPRRVLIVDDSSAMRQLIALAVRSRGYEVAEAENGMVALDRISREKFDLIFLDLNMPVLDGDRFLQKLQELPERPAQICVVTTEADSVVRERMTRLGANHFLHKPISRREIDRILGQIAAI